jgi:hypothetical protein
MMRLTKWAPPALACALMWTGAQAQSGRGGEWTTHSGDPQRTAWQKNETRISKESIKGFRLLWKLKLDNQTRALHSLTAPLIVNAQYRDLAIIAGTSDNIYVLDADLGRLLWIRLQLGDSLRTGGAQDSAAGYLQRWTARLTRRDCFERTVLE